MLKHKDVQSSIEGVCTEEELRESRKEFQTLFNLMPDPVVIVDGKGKFLAVNDRVEEITGFKREELLGKKFLSTKIVTEKSKAILIKNLTKRRIGMHLAPYEVEVLTKDGKKFPFEINATKIGYAGKPADMVIFRGITERKQMEETLRESEEKYRTQFGEALDAILVADVETGIIIDCNRAASELVGREKSELIGKHQRIFHPPEGIEGGFSRTFKQHLKEKEGQVLEDRVITKNGEIKDVAIKANVFELKGKKLIQGIFRDVTERKAMERKLQEYAEHLEDMVEEKTKELRESQDQLEKSEEMYRLLVESSNDGISIVDFEGKILFANRKLKEMYGYEEMEGMSIVENIHPDVRKEVLEDIQKAAMTGKIGQNVIVKALRKDGGPFWIETNAVFVKENGKPVGFLAVSRDITERKRMEERLLKSERLAAIGELATMVGHDLRNPLQSIENAIYCLNNELPRLPIPQKTIEILQVINDSVNYADKITKDLQDFSATKELILQKTNINTIVKETLLQVETPENVKLTTELGHLPEIKADKDMIKRVFLNLAVNGIQAMEKGGTLKVSTKKTKGFVEVSFKDTGIGLSKENMEKLFITFFTTKAKGMGLGLAICKRFVESHGGSIEVESKEGKGSTFAVKLPIQ